MNMPNHFGRSRVLALGLVFSLVACAPTVEREAAPSRNPENWPRVTSPFDPAETRQIDQQIDALLAQMTVAQKVGQITQAEVSRVTPEEVKQYHLGSVLNGGGGFLHGDKHASVDDWVAAMDAYYEASVDTSDGGLAIPIMWGTDAVHGHNKIVGATLFPHNIGLGATRNGELVEAISAATAKQVLATGMDWTFSPSVSVVRDLRWGRTYESYSEDPQLVAKLGAHSVKGYQGSMAKDTFMDDDRVIATAKHFIADGGTIDGVDRGNNVSSEQELATEHAPGYYQAIAAGTLTVMASHNSWHGTRLHGESYLLTDILKQRLGFDGMVIGDWNSHGLVDGCSNTRCPQSFNAGVDMLMVPFEWKEWLGNTIEDVNSGAIPMARLDDAVRRILRTKFRAGLMSAPRPSERPYAGRKELMDAPEYRQLARRAVRESQVLLKNNGQLLPLNPNAKVLVAGEAADDIAQQSGGWTISWQSRDLSNEDFPNATSIYGGIADAVTTAGGSVEFAADGEYREKPDVAIVVYGESPYAEWQGDLRHLAFEAKQHRHAKLLERLQAQGVATVSVFISGRPLWVNRALNASDAFVAAWLPGTEGAGVADLLFTRDDGHMAYDFTGKLPFFWPRTPDQTSSPLDDAPFDPLFPYGYGLSYQQAHDDLPALPTEVAMDQVRGSEDIVLFDGRAQSPWEMHISATNQAAERYLSGIASNGALTLTEADQATQGDAVNARWDGSGTAAIEINNPGANRNFTKALEENGALVFDVRLLQPAERPVTVGMACRGEGCNAQVDVTTLVNASPLKDWNTLSISLQCFANSGVGFEEITQAFAIGTAGPLELQLTQIRLEPGMGDKAGVSCQ